MSPEAIGIHQTFFKTVSSTSGFTVNYTTMRIDSSETTTPPSIGDTLRLFGRQCILYQNERHLAMVQSIPETVWTDNIFSYLEPKEMVRCGLVCRSLHEIVDNELRRICTRNISEKRLQEFTGISPSRTIHLIYSIDRYLKRDRYIRNVKGVVDPGKMTKYSYFLCASLGRHKHTNDNPAVYVHSFREYYFARHGDFEQLRLPLPAEFLNLIPQNKTIGGCINLFGIGREAVVIVLDAGGIVAVIRVGSAFYESVSFGHMFESIVIEDTTHDRTTGDVIDEIWEKGSVLFRLYRRPNLLHRLSNPLTKCIKNIWGMVRLFMMYKIVKGSFAVGYFLTYHFMEGCRETRRRAENRNTGQ